ncbi:MAG: hypothetical protein HY904_01205 [Deltaproteobacteria bacterium]|nr:hypothetical protein [Deltaproteobacteria bacterium]
MSKRKTPWLENPFRFKTFFEYATGLPRHASGKGGKKPGKEKDKGTVTTMAVGEEGTGTPPPPPGKTTPAIGEEGAGDVPTTTIAKGEEAG